MTFYEAAIEVLREAGRPLHYKKITELSLKRNLLSHVGKTPESTMRARLAQELKKEEADTLIKAIRPGVFTLKDGADVSEAKQTIRLRQPAAAPARPAKPAKEEPVAPDEVAAAEDETEEEETQAADATEERQEARDESKVKKSGRGRSRRSRRSRDEDEDVAEARSEPETSTDSSDDEDNEDKAPRRRRRRRGRNDDDVQEAKNVPETKNVEEAKPEVSASSDDDSDDDDSDGRRSRRRRRRGRRGGRSRTEESTPESAPESAPQKRSAKRKESTTAAPLAAADGDAGELARAILAVFERSDDDVMELDDLVDALQSNPFGAARSLGTAALRDALYRANARRAEAGRPPIFIEAEPDAWTVATASGAALADSYAALDRWQAEHHRRLRDTLVSRLSKLDGDALATIVTLVLERQGYLEIAVGDRLAGELATLAAIAPRGLTTARVAVRILKPNQAASREDVIAFRGSLHVYSAAAGVIVTPAGFDEKAASEAVVANLAEITLIDANALAHLLVRAGVGVASFSVDVSCVDETFFQDFSGD